jgi:branched-subunit amino acid transport protein
MSIAIYILVMAGVTYLIRMIPFTVFRRKIKSRFIKSFLYYVPYSVLSAMTFPAIFYSTGDFYSALLGTVTALILAFFKKPLIVVALCSAAVALITALIV